MRLTNESKRSIAAVVMADVPRRENYENEAAAADRKLPIDRGIIERLKSLGWSQ